MNSLNLIHASCLDTNVDVIVNVANRNLWAGGGICGAIFQKAGLYKELTATDIKVIREKKGTKIAAYADVLQFMLDNNCKVEQESMKALS